jgi:SDR family mycofactocin-dependent oxidoreductase
MTGRLEGKTVLITGAARGQGRSHAVRMAEEGADIIAVDICADIETNPYPMATTSDLEETVALVEKTGQRAAGYQADVRDREGLRAAVNAGRDELGAIDVVVANAGILPIGHPSPLSFQDAVDVDLVGVMNTVAVTLAELEPGASIIVIGSVAALKDHTTSSPAMAGGGSGYTLAKRTLVDYVETLALQMAPTFIRVNCVHPTNCNTHLIHFDEMYKAFRPDLESPTREEAEQSFVKTHAMPIPYIEPIDVSHLVVYLAADESRYVTGQQIRVDAGLLLLS